MPFVEGVGWLYGVMPINEQGGTPGRILHPRIDERMTRRRDDPHMVEANPSQMLRQPIRAIPYVVFVPRLSADRREADEVFEFLQNFLSVSPGVGERARPRHDSPASLQGEPEAGLAAGIVRRRRLVDFEGRERAAEACPQVIIVVADGLEKRGIAGR